MEMRGSVLNGREIERIHDDSIRILEEVGVKVPSEQILTLLEAGGAQVDWDGQIARISGQMVEEALKSAPAQFTLGARNPKFDLALPSADTTLNMDGCGSNTIDFQTGKRRLALLSDLEDAAKLLTRFHRRRCSGPASCHPMRRQEEPALSAAPYPC